MSTFNKICVTTAAAGWLVACGASEGPEAPTAPATTPTVAEPSAPTLRPAPAPAAVADAASTCPDDGPRLPLSGVCAGRAINYMDVANSEPAFLGEGCTWVPQETQFADQVLLYLAASCEGRVAKLGFAGGARQAELSIETSAVAPGVEGQVLIRVMSADPDAPGSVALFWAREAYAAEGASPEAVAACRVRMDTTGYLPEGAFVIDDLPEGVPEPADGPRTACGPFGLDQDSTKYWREWEGFSWFYDLGQDAYQDIDPRSLTLLPLTGAEAPTP